MKFRLRPLAVLGCLLTVGASVLYAQVGAPRPGANQPARRSGGTVAVIDIGRIFKEHVRLKTRMDSVQNEVKAFEEHVNKQRQEISDDQKKLSQYKPESPEYKKIEESITRRLSELRVRAELKRKEIQQQETKIYYETYQEVTGVVQRIADQYNISLVLRFNSKEMDPQNRESVLRGVNNNIVFQRNRDITDMVLRVVNPKPAYRPGGNPR